MKIEGLDSVVSQLRGGSEIGKKVDYDRALV